MSISSACLGLPTHLFRKHSQLDGGGNWAMCGVQSRLLTTDWRAVECLRCRRTREYRAARHRAQINTPSPNRQ